MVLTGVGTTKVAEERQAPLTRGAILHSDNLIISHRRSQRRGLGGLCPKREWKEIYTTVLAVKKGQVYI